jgi:N-acetylglutamate synthase-like GNAT family acetyltransferase
MSAPGTEQDDVSVVAAPYGLELYRQTLALREAILREPLGLTLTEEGLADGALRQNFCAISHSAVVGSASLKPLDRKTLQLQQMAVAEDRRQEQIGMQLLACAEDWRAGKITGS